MIEKDAKIFVFGHDKMIGASLVKSLKAIGFYNIVTKHLSELNLINQNDVRKFYLQEQPEYVFLPNIVEGGILANITHPAELIYTNLQMQLNLIHFAWEAKVKKLLFMGSSCTYPKFCAQPMKEESLLTGALEPTNEAYAVAKIAGIKMCQAYNQQYGTSFISVIPATIYGPGDNFDPETSHVIPALIHKFHDAKSSPEGEKSEVAIWGSGTPQREFLYVDDFADACLFLMNNYAGSDIINIGYGEDISIRDLAMTIKDIVGFEGRVTFDASKPDGMPKKLLDSNKLKTLGWRPKITLRKGIEETYRWYLQNSFGR